MMKKNVFFACCLISLLILTACNAYKISEPLEPIDIFFLQTVNDSDCIVIQIGTGAIIIDTGEEQDGQRIIEFLNSRNIKTITALILTHPDKDHIGSALLLLENFHVENVIQPFYPPPDELLDQINETIKKNKIPLLRPIKRRFISFSNFSMMLYPPLERTYQRTNNYSLAVLGIYGNKRMLFTGDAVGKRIRELMAIEWPVIDLYKVPYHGRAGRSSVDFFRQLKPEYAVVTAKRADTVIMEAAADGGTKMFYTGDGDIHFICNGLEIIPVIGENYGID